MTDRTLAHRTDANAVGPATRQGTHDLRRQHDSTNQDGIGNVGPGVGQVVRDSPTHRLPLRMQRCGRLGHRRQRGDLGPAGQRVRVRLGKHDRGEDEHGDCDDGHAQARPGTRGLHIWLDGGRTAWTETDTHDLPIGFACHRLERIQCQELLKFLVGRYFDNLTFRPNRRPT